jgi:hypothetical protein
MSPNIRRGSNNLRLFYMYRRNEVEIKLKVGDGTKFADIENDVFSRRIT